jgi:hypothetical protein
VPVALCQMHTRKCAAAFRCKEIAVAVVVAVAVEEAIPQMSNDTAYVIASCIRAAMEAVSAPSHAACQPRSARAALWARRPWAEREGARTLRVCAR